MAALDWHYSGLRCEDLSKQTKVHRTVAVGQLTPPRHGNEGQARPTDSFPLSCAHKDADGGIFALDRGYVRVVDM